MTVTEFVTARLGEDEAWAKQMAEPGGYHWPWLEQRVLREVETWRRILLEYQTAGLDTSVPPERVTGFRYALSFAIKAKAATYPDHPDYTPDAWAPAYAG